MNLMDLLPSFYEGNKTMEELQGVLSGDVSTMINSLHKMVDECFVGTASDTLRRYENIFGISQVVDQFKNTSASGNPVTISNLLTPVTALKLEAVGQTVQTTSQQGKNLFPKKALNALWNGITIVNNSDGSYALNGVATASAGITLSNVSLTASTYTFSTKNVLPSGAWLSLSNNSDTMITPNLSSKTFSGLTGTFHGFFWVNAGAVFSNYVLAIQLELGSTATPYAPFVPDSPSPDCQARITGTTALTVSDGGNNSQAINLPQTLYSLPDGTADNYDVVSGSGTQNVGKMLFNGTENWSKDFIDSTAFRWKLMVPDAVHRQTSANQLLCSHYPSGMNTTYSKNQSITLSIIDEGAFYIFDMAHQASTLSDWKSYLAAQYDAGTPVTVLYELAAPQTITGMGQTIPVYHPTTTLSVDAGTINVTLRSLDAKATLRARRSRIKSKMRARGVTTIGIIKNIAESFLNDEGSVEVTEYNPEYRFLIKYVEILGLPPNIDGLKAAVDEIKPAHLDYGIYFEDRVPGKLGIAAISKLGITLTLYPWQVHHYESIGTLRTAAAMKSCLSVTVLERG